MAHNLNVAMQPALADACWPSSKMDFRSNEAGRTVSKIGYGARDRTDFRAATLRFPLKPPVTAAGASSRNIKIETLSFYCSDEQICYLESFTTGLQISRVGRDLGSANT